MHVPGVSICHAPCTQVASWVSGGQPGGVAVYVHERPVVQGEPDIGSAGGQAEGMQGGD
jgi:hypothetical protein